MKKIILMLVIYPLVNLAIFVAIVKLVGLMV